ncbi:oligosaccharide flippase family protein [Sphingobacterium faecium]|uniref:oligosaccharide flippase family protein n=1 Tax=Sphingobacterium faecium TaxID=34087 RepID=UPI003DA6A33F
MNNKSTSYKGTVKSTAIFGIAQVIQMLTTILRAKLIAVIFGSFGMGVNAIFQSTISIISNFSSFGIFQSGVRELSSDFENKDEGKLMRKQSIFNRLVWLSGIIGGLVCIFCAIWLSSIAFQNSDYSLHFVILSIAVFFTALSNGQIVFLQVTRNISSLAKASLIGALFGVLTAVPLYYYAGRIGIPISISLSAVILYITQLYYTKKLKIFKPVKIILKDSFKEAAPIIKIGSVLMLGMVLLTIFSYLTNIFIGRYGKIEDVGLFQGASSITTQSISIVITVLASDFFPRLSAVFQEKDKVNRLVNEQAEIVSLIIAPITIVILVFAPIIIRALLSQEFVVILPVLRLMSLSLLARGIWLIMSYVILAFGDKKAYLIYDSIISNGLLCVLNISSYVIWGLEGLGISFLVGATINAIILSFVVKSKYDISFSKEFYFKLFFLGSLILCSYFIMDLKTDWLRVTLSYLVVCIVTFYSIYVLNRRTGFIDYLRRKV